MNLQNDPNLANIEYIAQALGDLRNSVVLVGGAVVGILLLIPIDQRHGRLWMWIW